MVDTTYGIILKTLCVILPVSLLLTACRQESQPATAENSAVLRLAVTTSLQDSGLLDVLIPVFNADHEVRVDVIAVGTGAALKLGEAGDVDVVFVHARQAEDAFMAAGHGLRRETVMYNAFEILGPGDDPAGIRDREPSLALQRIAESGQRFVSRGDDSGTHQREQQIWDGGGGRPEWNNYMETGQGMGATLTVADQMNAYVLSDHGTYLKFKSKIHLVPLVTSAESLRNEYGILVVNPERHSKTNASLGQAFVDFIVSQQVQMLIRDYRIEDEQLFFPLQLPDDQ